MISFAHLHLFTYICHSPLQKLLIWLNICCSVQVTPHTLDWIWTQSLVGPVQFLFCFFFLCRFMLQVVVILRILVLHYGQCIYLFFFFQSKPGLDVSCCVSVVFCVCVFIYLFWGDTCCHMLGATSTFHWSVNVDLLAASLSSFFLVFESILGESTVLGEVTVFPYFPHLFCLEPAGLYLGLVSHFNCYYNKSIPSEVSVVSDFKYPGGLWGKRIGLPGSVLRSLYRIRELSQKAEF